MYWFLILMLGTVCKCQESTLVIRSLDIISGVRMRFATTKVRTVVENIGDVAEEYNFVSYLPEYALVTNFTMEVDNYQSIATLRPKTKAEDLFDVARKTGATSATTSEDANVFTTDLSIAPKKTISFELTYEEVLVRTHGIYKHVINVQPNLDVDKIRVRVRLVERGRIDRNKLKVPKFGFAIGSNTNEQLLQAPQEVGVKLKSSITDNISVIDINYEPNESGQLVVLYDIERTHTAGQIEIVNGYFVHFFSPTPGSSMESGAKNIMFVLDASYSMCGRRWDQLKKALTRVWRDLKESDYFNIVTFNSDIHAWRLRSHPATRDNVADAIQYLDKVIHRGGSNLHDSMAIALDMLRVDESNPMVSMMVFVTDGYTNKGVLSSSSIVRGVTRLNKEKYSIHTLAFGRGADFSLLQKVSSHNRGISRRIYEDTADATAQLIGFFHEIQSPLLNSLRFRYLNSAVDMNTLVSQQGPASRVYREGSEIIIAGKLKDEIKNPMKVEVLGRNAEGKEVVLKGESVLRVTPAGVGGFVERMWAFLRLKDLIETAKGTVSKTKRRSLVTKAMKLSRKYHFVSEITSLLVIPLELKTLTTSTSGPPVVEDYEDLERAAVVRKVEEEHSDGTKHRVSVPVQFRPSPPPFDNEVEESGLVAGSPMEESVVAVDALRGEKVEGGRAGSQSEILEQNAIATDPLLNVDLRTLIEIANPLNRAKDVKGIWRNTYVGPITRNVQGYARLLSSLDPGTTHFAEMNANKGKCGNGERLDVVFVIDVTEHQSAEGISGPGVLFILKNLAQRIIGSFIYNKQYTRVGLIAYKQRSGRGQIIYNLRQNQNVNALINIVRKLDSNSTREDSYNVLSLSEVLFKHSFKKGTKRVVVLLSGNDAFGRHRTSADRLRKHGVTILALSPHQTNSNNLNQLTFITGKEENVFSLPDPNPVAQKFCNIANDSPRL